MRKAAKTRRAAIGAEARRAAALAVARHFGQALDRVRGAVVAGYWPLPDELDPRPLMELLVEQGAALALPGPAEPGQALRFLAYRMGDPLQAGPFGVMTPLGAAVELRPDLVLVPLLAFDPGGGRLGYGGGFYDRTLAALRKGKPPPVAVGLAYAAQEVGALPLEPGDQGLDWIVTETGARRLR